MRMRYQRAQDLEREFDALIALIADMIAAQAEKHVPTPLPIRRLG